MEVFIQTDCCGEPYDEDYQICPGCKDHCSPAYFDENGKEITEQEYNNLR